VTSDPYLLGACLAGIGVGLLLLWRGFGGYRSAARVGDTATSRIASLAAGEVRVTGAVEPAEVTLVSPLQGRDCVWYRSEVTSSRRGSGDELDEERGIGFRVRDATGSIRVFPRGARIDAQDRFDERDSMFGEAPPGLAPRRDRVGNPPTARPRRRAAHRAPGNPTSSARRWRRKGRASATRRAWRSATCHGRDGAAVRHPGTRPGLPDRLGAAGLEDLGSRPSPMPARWGLLARGGVGQRGDPRLWHRPAGAGAGRIRVPPPVLATPGKRPV
jgi:hypothetical protein